MYTEIQEFLVGKGTQKNEQRSLYPYISWILISLAPQRMYVVRVGPQRMLGPIIRVGWNKTLHLRVVKLIPFSDSVQFSSIAQSCQTLCDPMNRTRQACLSITNSWSLLKLMPIKSVMPSSHLILCRHLLLLPPTTPSIRVFSNESTLHMRWPKYWSFSFSISPSKEHPGLISFRMDWLDLLVVQGTLKSLLQHHSSKASIFLCSAFFTV